MRVTNSPKARISAGAKSPKTTPSNKRDTSLVRDVLAVGAGTAAGTLGGIYGVGEGVVKNLVPNFKSHPKKGAEIGRKILTPVGGATGALATAGLACGAALAVPLFTALGTVLGFAGGTAVSALKQAPAKVSAGAAKGAKMLAERGQALGTAGAVVGKLVGGALGGIGGAVVALGKGVPDGLGVAGQQLRNGKEALTALPQFTRQTWNIAYNGGHSVAGAAGALSGGSLGVVVATGDTVLDGAANGVHRGAQWTGNTYNWVQGK